MPEDFDPYHSWLGIPPREQPPNLYRLLGLSRFEANLNAIETAYEQRMWILRRHQSGKHQRLTQQLLNEVGQAKNVLMDASRRRDYDQSL